MVITVASILGTVVLSGCGSDTDSATDMTTASGEATSSERFGGSPAEAVAAMTGPSVVNVQVSGVSTSPFFGSQPYEGVGSGVIYTADGYIITNAHVVTQNERLADEVEVTFSSGETVSATIVATDSFTDIAVIEVDRTGMPAATFAIDSIPTLGEYAIAIGSPLDYSNSVTLGIVSGLGRSIENAGSTALVDLIQTDAAISPGNSGGALVDEEGRVIGINVAYLPPNTTGAENIGFAIPAATAARVADELIANGRASHAYLGVNYVSVTRALQRQYGLSRDAGVLITALDPQGPAAGAGLKQGDILLEMEGTPIVSETDMILILRDLRPGDSVPVTVDREGETFDLSITVGERSPSTI
jgi:serine protease Do